MQDLFGTKMLSLFPTFLLVGRVPEAERLNAQLKDVITAKRAADPGIQRTNMLGWHSDVDMLQWGGDAAKKLGQLALAFCDRHSADRRNTGAPRFFWHAEMWANVSPPNASNQIHCHPGTLWSCVYYVDDGFDGPDAVQGGELVFYDPRFPLNRMYAPDLVTIGSDGKPENERFVYRPETGTIVGFPAWLDHGVNPYKGTRERISIAINLTVVPGTPEQRQAPKPQPKAQPEWWSMSSRSAKPEPN